MFIECACEIGKIVKTAIKRKPRYTFVPERRNDFVFSHLTVFTYSTKTNSCKMFCNEIDRFLGRIIEGEKCISLAGDGCELMKIIDAIYRFCECMRGLPAD